MDTLRENDLFETVSGFSIPRPDQLSLTKTVLISSHNVTPPLSIAASDLPWSIVL